ncbi:MAG TPA: iron ABC transporter permease [Permianibacter sp.]|nr:iron ABC transporter permease [Permianibacter sp.]
MIASLTLIPLLVLLAQFLVPQPEIWSHLREWVLPRVLANTFWLLLGVMAGVLALGIPLAWLTAVCEFPGRRVFRWALLLPLAMPAYVLAFVHVGLWDYTGPIQTLLRALFGDSLQLPSVRSRLGVIVVMSCAFYPYVYLLARSAFLTQGRRALEVAASLGLSPWQGFWRVALPLARPALVAGATLALMETLADFGTVSVFNYDTFTTAIYQSWFALYSLPAAAQLASLLTVTVLLLMLAERRLRAERRYGNSSRASAPLPRMRLRGARAWLATGFCLLVLVLAFLVPLVQLLYWVVERWADDADLRLLGFTGRSLLLSLLAALLVTAVALLLAYLQRLQRDRMMHTLARLGTLGYAIPGTVLAVGFFLPLAWLDNQLIAVMQAFGGEGHALLRGGLLTMLLAYLVRFLAVAHEPLDSGLARVSLYQDDAARSLGYTGWRLLRTVHLPQLKPALLTALLMVFVDVMKEMPITLMTRPFGWDTLAVRVFEMTSEGQWDRAAVPAVAIVLAGLLPVWLLIRQSETSLHERTR